VIRNPLDSPLGLLIVILLVSLISLLSEENLQYSVAWRFLELNLKMPLRLMKVLGFYGFDFEKERFCRDSV